MHTTSAWISGYVHPHTWLFFPRRPVESLSSLPGASVWVGYFRGLGCLREIGLRYSQCSSCLSVPMCVWAGKIPPSSCLFLGLKHLSPMVLAVREGGMWNQIRRPSKWNPGAGWAKCFLSMPYLNVRFHPPWQDTAGYRESTLDFLPVAHTGPVIFSVRHLSKTSVSFCPIFL